MLQEDNGMDCKRRLLAHPGPSTCGAQATSRPQSELGIQEHRQASCLQLRILATSDLHGQFLSYDHYENRPLSDRGLVALSAVIAAAREAVPGALLFDNGDFLQGTALVEHAARKRQGHLHPAIAAFNTLGYDAVSLGNHEFNYGLEFLEEITAAAKFPVLAANICRRDDGGRCAGHLVSSTTIIERDLCDQHGETHRIRIGVMGLTPPEITRWDCRHLSNRLIVLPMVETARAQSRALRMAGADVVICLAHTGVAQNGEDANEDRQAAILAATGGMDAVIAGHSHVVFPRPSPVPKWCGAGLISGVPVVQPGCDGTHLGLIDLCLESRNGGWRIANADAMNISAHDRNVRIPASARRWYALPLRQALRRNHRATLSWMRERLGQTDVTLSTFFATVAENQALKLVSAALCDHVRDRLQGQDEADLPVVAAVVPYRVGGRAGPRNYTMISPGPLFLRNVHDLYPFPNTVVAKRVTGRALAERLGCGTRIFNRIQPGGTDQFLIDPLVSPSFFQVIPGLSWRVDLSKPADSERISGLCHADGRPVLPDEEFILVINSHLRCEYDAAINPPVLDEGILCSDVLASYIRRKGLLQEQTGPGWSFAPMRGTSLLFDTGIHARGCLSDIDSYRPEDLGVTEEGFRRFRLHL